MARHGPDHIVGFKSRVLEHGDAHRIEQPPHLGNLLDQVGRSFRAIGLVLDEFQRTEGRLLALENRGDVWGIELLQHLPQHAIENEDGLGG
jgi:hypothetical protein